MAKRPLPSPTLLRQLLKYDPEEGKLYWVRRPTSMFKPSRIKQGVRTAEWSANKWNTRFAGKEAFTATRNDGYRIGSVNGRLLRAHRVAWVVHYGEWPAEDIDHIDGDPTNNRINNLRDVSNLENHRNEKKSANNTSGFNGVHWDAANKKWRALIKVNFRNICLGRHDSFDAAVAARKAANARYGFTDRHGT